MRDARRTDEDAHSKEWTQMVVVSCCRSKDNERKAKRQKRRKLCVSVFLLIHSHRKRLSVVWHCTRSACANGPVRPGSRKERLPSLHIQCITQQARSFSVSKGCFTRRQSNVAPKLSTRHASNRVCQLCPIQITREQPSAFHASSDRTVLHRDVSSCFFKEVQKVETELQ